MSTWSTGALVAVIAAVMYLLFVFPVKHFPVHEEGAILITGTSTGIGRDAAVVLANKGYTVFATVRKEGDRKSLEEENIATLKPIIMDVTKPEQIREAVQTVKASGKKLIGLVNNAGVSARVPLEAHDMDRLRHMFEVNVFGVFAVAQAFLPMIRENQGRIVNIGSVAGFIAMPGSSGYSATKFGLKGITDSLRREMAPFDVSVSIVEPGFVATAIASKSTGSHSSANWVSKGVQETYKWFYDGFEEKRLRGEALADTPDVTTKAIVHALTNATPEARYVVANVYGVPAKLVALLSWALPDRAEDLLLRQESRASNLTTKAKKH